MTEDDTGTYIDPVHNDTGMHIDAVHDNIRIHVDAIHNDTGMHVDFSHSTPKTNIQVYDRLTTHITHTSSVDNKYTYEDIVKSFAYAQ